MMPEEMPTPKKSLKELERERKKIRTEMKNNNQEEKLNKVGTNCLITIYRNSFEKAHK